MDAQSTKLSSLSLYFKKDFHVSWRVSGVMTRSVIKLGMFFSLFPSIRSPRSLDFVMSFVLCWT